MNVSNSIWHFMRADFLERSRRKSFLLVLAVTILLGYIFVPTSDANYVIFMRAFYRGVYNSAWIGILYGTVCSIFLPLFGFYLVKNTIERDHKTKVGQIIATTPTSKTVYLVGKSLSNLAVLSVILSVMAVMAVIMQLVRAEDTNIILGQLIPSIWVISFPILALTSALAVAFESVPFLSRGMGNFIFFFLWITTLSAGLFPTFFAIVEPRNDLLSITRPTASIQQSILAIDPEADMGSGGLVVPKEIFGEELLAENIKIFYWEGIDWTASIILQRMLWLALPFAITLAAAIPFDRFDPARSKSVVQGSGCLTVLSRSTNKGFSKKSSLEAQTTRMTSVNTQLTPITNQKARWRFGGILLAELRLLLKGRNLIWYSVMLGLFVAGLIILPIAWLWPIFVWSSMGGREEQHFTHQFVYSAAFPLRRQLPAAWLSGVLVSVFSVGGVGLQLYFSGETSAFLAVLIGAFFVPALALALGVLSGGQRLFEIAYLVWWYLAINGVTHFGLIGGTNQAILRAENINYISAIVVLILLTVFIRWRKIQQ